MKLLKVSGHYTNSKKVIRVYYIDADECWTVTEFDLSKDSLKEIDTLIKSCRV